MAAMGYDIGPPTRAQLDEMKTYVRDAMLERSTGDVLWPALRARRLRGCR